MERVTRPETMAVIFAEILGNLAAIVETDSTPAVRLKRAKESLQKSWNAVEHFTRSLALMGDIELTAGDIAGIKRAWLRMDPKGQTFKEKLAQVMRGAA